MSSENYIVINGKKAELTKEQLKALGVEVRKNPFAKVGKMERYMFIDVDGNITSTTGDGIGLGNKLYSVTNYFNDEYFANQIALHQLLYRKLSKYAYENEYEDVEWNSKHAHWLIYYNANDDKFYVGGNDAFKYQGVYFLQDEARSVRLKKLSSRL